MIMLYVNYKCIINLPKYIQFHLCIALIIKRIGICDKDFRIYRQAENDEQHAKPEIEPNFDWYYNRKWTKASFMTQ